MRVRFELVHRGQMCGSRNNSSVYTLSHTNESLCPWGEKNKIKRYPPNEPKITFSVNAVCAFKSTVSQSCHVSLWALYVFVGNSWSCCWMEQGHHFLPLNGIRRRIVCFLKQCFKEKNLRTVVGSSCNVWLKKLISFSWMYKNPDVQQQLKEKQS